MWSQKQGRCMFREAAPEDVWGRKKAHWWAKAENPDFPELHPSCVKDISKVLTAWPKVAWAPNCWGHTLISEPPRLSVPKGKYIVWLRFHSAWAYNHPWVWNALRNYPSRTQRDDKLASKKRCSMGSLTFCLSLQDICTLKALLPP